MLFLAKICFIFCSISSARTFINLTFTTLLAYSADDKLVIFFLFFQRKQYLTFHASCLHCMKCHNWFSGINKKKYFIMSSAENFAQSAKC